MASIYGRTMALLVGGGTIYLAGALLMGDLPAAETGIGPVDQLLGFLASARDVVRPLPAAGFLLAFGLAFAALCLAPASPRTRGGGSGSWFDGDGSGGDGGD